MRILRCLHERFGDFWWYSLMLFAAMRFGDLINAFVGLWLVPKYVDPSELGVVLPLTQFATTLAMPASVFATVFMKQVNVLAVKGEYGKMKTLLRGVFVCTGVFLLLALAISRLVMPHFLERLRVAEGMLGFLVLLAAFVGCAAPIYSNALQAMKRFKTLSVLNALAAPVRLLAMLVSMPVRALSGYFVGQAAPPVFMMVASVFSLRRELRVQAERYWTRDVIRGFLRYALFVTIGSLPSLLVSVVETTIIRQRLPAADSAAFYMLSRLSEVSSYVGMTLIAVVFPYASEAAEKGKDTRNLLFKSMAGSMGFGLLAALGFLVCGKSIMSVLPNGRLYADYSVYLPLMTLFAAINMTVLCYTNIETAANRFSFLWWWIPLHVIYAAALLCLTGYGYFRGVVPDSWLVWVESVNPYQLKVVLGLICGCLLVKLAIVFLACLRRKGKSAIL